MKKYTNKGFTIVELVIVVAVIAILAAVLIPTVSGLIKTAQTSADVTLVKNVNLFLATESAKDGKNPTMHDAIEDVKKHGYDITKLTPTNSDNDILWDQVSDRFVLFANGKYDSVGSEAKINEDELYNLWKIYEKMPAVEDQTYSIYWDGGDISTATVNVSFDAGENYVANVNYETDAAQNAIIRTNYGALKVNAPNATVVHYGSANLAEITAVASHSYVEHGDVELAKISSGRIVVAQDAELSNVHVVADGAAIAVVGNATLPSITRDAAVSYIEVQSLTSEDATDSTPEYIVADAEGNNKVCSDKEGNNVVTSGSALAESVKEQFVTMKINDVANAEQLKAALESEEAKMTINITADIDLGTESLVVTKSTTIYGNGHSITTNTASRGSVVEIAVSDISVEIYNLTMINKSTVAYTRGINFSNDVNNSTLIVDGCSVSAEYYTIRAGRNENITVIIRNGSVSSGWAALDSFSKNSTFIVENSVLKGLNDQSSSPENNFATIVIEGNNEPGKYGFNNTLTIVDSTIYADTTEGNSQFWISIYYGAQNNTVKVDEKTQIINSHGADETQNYRNSDASNTIE